MLRFKSQLIQHLTSIPIQLAVILAQQSSEPHLPQVEETFQIGDLVWLEDKTQTSKAHSRKLANIWTGPFIILDIFPNRNVKLLCQHQNQPRFELRVSFDRIRRFSLPIYMPWILPGKPFKFPNFILAKKIRNSAVYYKIQWLSTLPVPDSWEPTEKLPPQLVYNYEHKLLNKSALPLQPRLPLQSDDDDSQL
jgi:hypothetical protein